MREEYKLHDPSQYPDGFVPTTAVFPAGGPGLWHISSMSANPHVIPWYTVDEWRKVRAVSRDPDSMGFTFEQWLKEAEKIAKHEEGLGAVVQKVFIEADKLIAWSARNQLDIVSKNRIAYALDVFCGLA